MRLTLQQIRDCHPCKEGWTKLLKSLDNPSDLSISVSIGQIARSNGPQDALWCLRCTEFDRRDVIRCILPSVKRASKYNEDRRVISCIETIEQWLNGEDANLFEAARAANAAAKAAYSPNAAYTAYTAYAADASYAAAKAANAVANAAAKEANTAVYASYAAACAVANTANTAYAAYAGYERYVAAYAANAARIKEETSQVEDICRVFP